MSNIFSGAGEAPLLVTGLAPYQALGRTVNIPLRPHEVRMHMTYE